jgi:two-component system response regulator AtoC
MTPRVLVAEDDEAAREGLRHLLALWGYEAEAAADGQEALERAVALRPSLIITDLAMPKMDGLALLHAVRAVLPETRIIVVTGDDRVERLPSVAKGGTVDCLTKPVDVDRLKGLITRHRRQE